MTINIDRPETTRHDVVVVQGATEPPVTETITDRDGTAHDLTGATVRFQMRAPDADTLLVDDPATITDASAGRVEYRWAPSDTTTSGHYVAYMAVDDSGGTGQAFDPNRYEPTERYLTVQVRPRL